MALSLKKIEEAYNKLKEYNGENPYIIKLKNIIIAYQTRAMNDFESEYVLSNFDREPKEINKMVMISDWYGEKLKENLEIEFVPKKLKVTWYLGETDTHYHFYCIYRKSQDKAVELFAPKKGILTNFLMEDYHDVEFDVSKYIYRKEDSITASNRCGKVYAIKEKMCYC